MAVTTAQLDGWFKRVYADSMSNAVPEFALLRKQIPFKKTEKIGENYNFPVKLSRSHGITWAGGASAGTTFALNDAISMVTKNAQVTGSELVLREQISYGAISRSGTSNDESFGPVLDEVPLEMAEAANFYLEMALLYGGTSIGAIEVDGNPNFTITKLTWAAGLWCQMENAKVDVYDPTLVTKRNTVGPLVVSAVAADTRIITCTGDAADLAAVQVGDVFVPVATVGNWFSGIDKIVTNTGSLFGISAATYNLWKGNTYSAASAALTMNKVQAALTSGVVRGLMEDVDVFMSTWSWTDLNNDLAGLRRYTESTKTEADLGTNKITFYGANGGKLSLQAHAMCKAGEAFILPLKRFKRIGSSDVTFQLPDMPQGQFFRHLESSAGVELRNYFDQGLICRTPAKCVKITNIVNTSL